MKSAPLLALCAALACAPAGQGVPDAGQPLDFVIKGLQFHIASGAAVNRGGALTFYLSDQPSACDAIQNVPVHTAMTLALQVAAQADGTTRAAVVARKPAPAPGEAVGGLTQSTGSTQDASVDAANGSVAWTANADGSYFVSALDVGFAGTSDRLTTGQLTLARCP